VTKQATEFKVHVSLPDQVRLRAHVSVELSKNKEISFMPLVYTVTPKATQWQLPIERFRERGGHS
jgi:hypothetical protein